MMPQIDIDIIIYGYLFICIALIIFNIVYIFYSAAMKKKVIKNTRWWKSKILEQMEFVVNGTQISTSHTELLKKRLKSTNQLLMYSYAIDEVRKDGRDVGIYLRQNYTTYQELAHDYEKKESMDKAFFAYFISENTPCYHEEYRPIMQILISFLEDSTVYCRENVLKAFYAFGNVDMLVHVLGLFDERGIAHHRKLLADGLMTFRGDKEELADLLWQKCDEWNTEFVIATIQFMSTVSDKYAYVFFNELQRDGADLEIRLAMMRYFNNNRYNPIKPVLLEYVKNADAYDINLTIVAASVLGNYPGEDTQEVLLEAMHSPNWYVRYNACSSLINMIDEYSDVQSILEGNDAYAKEIMTYMLEEKGESVLL